MFFCKQKSCVKYKLFRSYCMAMYGCELWSLNNDQLDNLCLSWRKSLRQIWRLPRNTHSYLLPILSRCLPLFDEICARSMKFIIACLSSDSSLVRAVANYGIFHGMQNSFLGRNAAFCVRRYSCRFYDVCCRKASINRLVKAYVDNSIEDQQLFTARSVYELILLRDKDLILPSNVDLSCDELDQLVNVICTS